MSDIQLPTLPPISGTPGSTTVHSGWITRVDSDGFWLLVDHEDGRPYLRTAMAFDYPDSVLRDAQGKLVQPKLGNRMTILLLTDQHGTLRATLRAWLDDEIVSYRDPLA